MLNSAVELLRERGVAAVTVDAVLARSGAPRGSVYHHFPGGRSEIVLSAIRQAGDFISAGIDQTIELGDPAQALDGFVEFWKQSIIGTDYLAGCPIAAAAIDIRGDLPEAVALAANVFAEWDVKLRGLLVNSGVDPVRAARLATLVVAAVEGAVILCRTRRDTVPLDDVATELRPLLV